MTEKAPKCHTCWGHGLWATGSPSPMGPLDAGDRMPTKPCPECGANPNPLRGEARFQAWGFDGSGKVAGCDHAVAEDASSTLCGLPLNPRGFPTGEHFQPDAPIACKRCRVTAALSKKGQTHDR